MKGEQKIRGRNRRSAVGRHQSCAQRCRGSNGAPHFWHASGPGYPAAGHRSATGATGGSTASERFRLRLVLIGALGQEVVADTGAVQEKAVPGLAERGEDALVAPDTYFYLVDALGQARVQG